MDMDKLQIVFAVETDADPSVLLDIAQQFAEMLQDEIESYGSSATVDEDEISVGPFRSRQ